MSSAYLAKECGTLCLLGRRYRGIEEEIVSAEMGD